MSLCLFYLRSCLDVSLYFCFFLLVFFLYSSSSPFGSFFSYKCNGDHFSCCNLRCWAIIDTWTHEWCTSLVVSNLIFIHCLSLFPLLLCSSWSSYCVISCCIRGFFMYSEHGLSSSIFFRSCLESVKTLIPLGITCPVNNDSALDIHQPCALNARLMLKERPKSLSW